MARPKVKPRTAAHEEKTRWTAPELFRRPRNPISWVVEGLWAPGLTAFAALPKEGKSTLALQMAVAVAKGEPVLGRKTRQCGVLYISTDELSADVMERQLYPFLHDNPDVPLTLELGWQGGMDSLASVLADKPKTEAVVIDTLQSFAEVLGGGYASESKLMNGILTAVKKVGRPIAVLLLMHAPKVVRGKRGWEQSFYGSNAITGKVQNFWHLAKASAEAPERGPYVLNAKGRVVAHESLWLMRRFLFFKERRDASNPNETSHGFEWVLDDRARPEASSSENETRAVLLRILDHADHPLRMFEIHEKAAKLLPHSRQYIDEQVRHLVEASLIFRQGHPRKWEYVHPDNVQPKKEQKQLGRGPK